MSDSPVHVVVAAIFNDQGQVLLARRPEHVHQGGLWEFPGGKVELGESVSVALARELAEELGIVPERQRPLIRVRHDYPDKSVLLDVWRVDSFSGPGGVHQTTGREGQPLRWVVPAALVADDLPAANRAIINALRLPPCYLITPEPGDDIGRFLIQLQHVLEQGVKLVRLRAWHLGAQDYRDLAQQVLTLCHHYQSRLLISGELDRVFDDLTTIGADGVHLGSRQLMALSQRPVTEDVWLAASCHDHGEIEQARSVDVDFITVSPLLSTRSHPQAIAMGWPQFQVLTEHAVMPVYALGGLAVDHLEQAWLQGGQGIAAISSLWSCRQDRVVVRR